MAFEIDRGGVKSFRVLLLSDSWHIHSPFMHFFTSRYFKDHVPVS